MGAQGARDTPSAGANPIEPEPEQVGQHTGATPEYDPQAATERSAEMSNDQVSESKDNTAQQSGLAELQASQSDTQDNAHVTLGDAQEPAPQEPTPQTSTAQDNTEVHTPQIDRSQNDVSHHDTGIVQQESLEAETMLGGIAAEDPGQLDFDQSLNSAVDTPMVDAHAVNADLLQVLQSFPASTSPSELFNSGSSFNLEEGAAANDELADVLPSVEQDPVQEPAFLAGVHDARCNGYAFEDNDSGIFIPEEKGTPARPGVMAKLSPKSLSTLGAQQSHGKLTFAAIRNLQKKANKPKAITARPFMPAATSKGPNVPNLLRPALDDAPQGVGYQAIQENFANESIAELDKEDMAARKNFENHKKFYEDRRRRNGGLTFREDIEWMQIQQAEEVRREKRKRDLQKIKEEMSSGEVDQMQLFPDFNEPNDAVEGDDLFGEGFAVIGQKGTGNRRQPQMPQTQVQHQSPHEAEMEAMMVEFEVEKDRPRNKKRANPFGSDKDSSAKTPKLAKGGKSKTSAAKPRKAKASGVKAVKGVRKSAKQKREEQQKLAQTTSLITSNVFADQADQDAPDQPTFTATTNKAQALKELLASVQQEHKKEAATDMKVLDSAIKDFDGRGQVKPDGHGMWSIKGMATSLKPYQVLGTAFMRRRERHHEEPKGGLMADGMGLGKTLMMLANIINGRPPKGAQPRTTLLVASPGLLSQWEKEIKLHTNCNPPLMVMRYGPGNRLHSSASKEILLHHDMILTTYNEILRSYPDNKPPIECQTAEQKIVWWKNIWNKERGILHRIQFLRVVLDEAQVIKNHLGKTSIACRALMATHRWAVSGTPVLNGLMELYPYFKFLRVPHTGSFKIFKHNYCDPKNPENAERLLIRLNQFMLRRTHKDLMFGVPILKLPRADQVTHWCHFNRIERNIYNIVQLRFIQKINSWAEDGALGKSYSNALVMLLRLRQLTAHVLMLQFVMKDLLEREDIEAIRKAIEEPDANDDLSAKTIIHVRKQLDDLAREEKNKAKVSSAERDEQLKDESEEVGLEEDLNEVRESSSGRSFGKDYDFKPYLNNLTNGDSWEKAKQKQKCGNCGDGPHGLWITQCNHLICTPCYETATEAAADNGNERVTCYICGLTFRFAVECDKVDKPQTRSATKAKKKNQPENDDLKDDWLSLGGDDILPSAKTIAIKAQILNWIRENPDVKIIIYTQFLAMIRILAKVCKQEGWAAEEYHGKQSLKARETALDNFADGEKNTRVLLASLKCGGLGLNLTMASRVIVVDPWWNTAVEQQAFCRVFRIGQKNTTFMTRFCVKDTVDERLIRMQERKQGEIDEVMEDNGERVKNLPLRDLLRLFGSVFEDDEGRPRVKPYILVDDPDEHGGFHADRDHEGFKNDL